MEDAARSGLFNALPNAYTAGARTTDKLFLTVCIFFNTETS